MAVKWQLIGGEGLGTEVHYGGLVALPGLGILQHLPQEGLEASG